jgi:hypothetical protein
MPAPFRVTFRRAGKVEKLSAETLDGALRLLEERGRVAAAAPARETVDLRVRRFEPVQQVAARGELRGPGVGRAGVDVRGDGSAEAWTGRVRRALVPAEAGEDAYAALRRVLSGSTSVDP